MRTRNSKFCGCHEAPRCPKSQPRELESPGVTRREMRLGCRSARGPGCFGSPLEDASSPWKPDHQHTSPLAPTSDGTGRVGSSPDSDTGRNSSGWHMQRFADVQTVLHCEVQMTRFHPPLSSHVATVRRFSRVEFEDRNHRRSRIPADVHSPANLRYQAWSLLTRGVQTRDRRNLAGRDLRPLVIVRA